MSLLRSTPSRGTAFARGAAPWLLALLAGAVPVAAQSGVTVLAKGNVPAPVVDLPQLPKVIALSPRSTMLFADRDEVAPAPADYPPGTAPSAAWVPSLVDAWVPAKLTGTGMPELIQYQLPSDYKPSMSKRPLLVAWHGFGSSAKSVALQTTLDEQCESWGWIYLSVTGIDDKLFGAPVAQRNAEAAIRWMQDSFPVDRERICMVGFSMGAGIVANFAARHRDPADIMIAAVGLVSGSYDWTATWHADSAVQPWMENTWNFGGPPTKLPFAYQLSSDLYFDPTTYPPTPGVSLDLLAMARNLHGTPAYITWDTQDTLAYLPPQSELLGKLLAGWGDDVTLRPVAGTVNPSTGAPAPHSWAVLDEEELMNTLVAHSAKRMPADWNAQLGENATVAFAHVTQRTAGAFTWLSGGLDSIEPRIQLQHVINAAEVSVDAGAAGLSGRWPLHLQATSADASGFNLRLRGTDTPPSYFVDAATGQLVATAKSDPLTDSLLLAVPPGGSVDVLAYSVPWHARLWLAPDPGTPGGTVTLDLRANPGAKLAWVVLGTKAQLMGLPAGLKLMVPPLPPALLFAVPLDAAGRASVPAVLPDAPGMSGLSLLLQAVIQGPGPALADVSNAFRFDIQ